jgi:iron complex outermembrane receptor protein
MKKLFTTKMMGILCLLFIQQVLFAQLNVSGTVTDDSGEALIGVSVTVDGTSIGAATDLNGNFSIDIPGNSGALNFSYIGVKSQSIFVDKSNSDLTVVLETITNKLDEVVVTGSRGRPRTILTSAVPIDNINAAELKNSGQKTVDQMINYRVPSYNSSNQTISDATAHFDPSELRNTGPSRTLVLVNGKRKNQSALVYVNDTPGKGEVGVDMKSIPASAIERIEVLRDGASAQYGSDAIAGVVNIILKNSSRQGDVDLGTGITVEGDGLTYNADINKGFKIGESGFLNLTGSYYHQDYTNRPGEPGEDNLFGVDGSNPWIQENPDLGIMVGQPEYDKISTFANFGINYGENNQFYAFGGHTYRDGKSFALYRVPYWPGVNDSGLLTPPGETYQGFQPTFETTVNDISFTLGNKFGFSGWDGDVSLSYGKNNVDYLIGNSVNVSLGANSPIEFDPGGYGFDNMLANLDFNKSFDKLTLGFGTEARRENFEVRAGQVESYEDGGFGGNAGAQSFPGLQPENALEEDRTNIGVYGSFDYDATESFLVGGAIRFENYSDFGSNLSWKVNARQLIGESKGAIRASVSTGFRAPSLHQIYLSNIQTLVSGGTVSNQGTFNNVSDEIQALGVPALDAETSFNISAGITYKLADNFSLSADYYNISIDDRVLFTGEIGFTDDGSTNPVEEILIAQDVTSIKFFVNALDTRTQGIDVVANYSDIPIGSNALDFILAFNYNDTKARNLGEGDRVVGPDLLEANGYDIFNRKELSRITSARPKVKVLAGLNFDLGNLGIGFNNSYFGEVTWLHASNPANDQTFAGKLVTDLILGYQINEKIKFDITANNLFNVYPDVIDPKDDVVTDLGGRFKYPWEVNQFGFNGTTIRLGLNYKL